MQQGQESGVMQFSPDPQSRKILDALDAEARNKFINDAIKSYSKIAAPVQSVSNDNSPAALVNWELRRIFGGACDAIQASSADSADYVAITELVTNQRVKCGIKDAIDILKSLRQPITTQEVWEIISVLG
ncbi:MAG TPA: hypothetical protein V6C86_26820 [Oculatellaceae cyanobacterium]